MQKMWLFVFFPDSKYATGNLKWYIDTCVRKKNTRAIDQLIFSNDLAMRKAAFDPILF